MGLTVLQMLGNELILSNYLVFIFPFLFKQSLESEGLLVRNDNLLASFLVLIDVIPELSILVPEFIVFLIDLANLVREVVLADIFFLLLRHLLFEGEDVVVEKFDLFGVRLNADHASNSARVHLSLKLQLYQ